MISLKNLSLKGAVTRLENAIITLSGPAIAISGIIAGIDLLTGGSMMQQQGWLSLTWAICLLLTLDFQVLMLGARARRVYASEKKAMRKAGELLIIIVIAASISYVSVQMQSIIARSQTTITEHDHAGRPYTHTISIAQATSEMGINPIALIWERSSLVLVLIFMSGWFRDEEPEPLAQSQSHLTGSGATPEPVDYERLALAVAPLLRRDLVEARTAIIEEVRAQLVEMPELPQLNAPEPPVDQLEPPQEGQSHLSEPPVEVRLEAALQAILQEGRQASGRALAERAHCNRGTATEWLRARGGSDITASEPPEARQSHRVDSAPVGWLPGGSNSQSQSHPQHL